MSTLLVVAVCLVGLAWITSDALRVAREARKQGH